MDRRIQEVLALLAHPQDNVRVQDLAARVGVGVSRLGHLFKRELQMSIRAFIRERRLAEAVRLLVSTNEPVSAISFDAGFPDICNFNHTFKKRFGVSPSRYREHVRHGVGATVGKAPDSRQPDREDCLSSAGQA